MATRLEEIARRFVQPVCHIVVMTTVATARAVLYTASPYLAKDAFERDNADLLAHLTSSPQGSESVILRGQLAGHRQLAVPVHVGELRGRLILIGSQAFSSEDRVFAEEAAREIALLLYYEHRRHGWATQ